MFSAGKTLKELYPSLMHVTCVAHLLHNCAMRVRAHFKNIDEVRATIKAATIKNKDRKKDFHDAGLPSSPDPVITRWATWLRAALYYSENLPAVRTIVNNWTSAGLLVSGAKDAINVEGLVSDLVKINQYRTLAANVEFLEGGSSWRERLLGKNHLTYRANSSEESTPKFFNPLQKLVSHLS